jgi:hypothetical protein
MATIAPSARVAAERRQSALAGGPLWLWSPVVGP